ncbi:RNA 2'-phosphotransferase [Zooshikella harenae]|uniref:Probable RNA 2'-phosphotransferase n=1 Tax=Zooshikella harenae TaxID=2827238 RepID=A0ABS5ZDE1_9GAMM|nr:RNA 2'-phosphotransferase [Zooshikella harenae]MBU2712073.1 RNA 2'-phosphotransferase [Zooshikella harenae]
MDKQLKKVSKYLSFLLRHKPDSIGLILDEQGWASIAALIELTTDVELSREIIEVVVETNDKQRFSISEDGTKIRANQGHSIAIDLNLAPIEPPGCLYHGTATRFLASIMEKGITKQQRHHVHLTESIAVGKAVGGRYGKPVILVIDAQAMFQDGFVFFKTANNVWLVEEVPPAYIRAC